MWLPPARRQGIDIGPVGCSALIKACALHRDVDMALDVFDKMLKRQVSFNRFTYNCMLHLCAVVGRLDDALAIYNLMRLETDLECYPDRTTYL